MQIRAKASDPSLRKSQPERLAGAVKNRYFRIMLLSLKEIAERAGVSLATASRVINKNRDVRPQSRQKVEAVLAEHVYAPDRRAVSLARGSEAWPLLAMTLPRHVTPHFLALLEGLRDGLSGAAVHLVIRDEGTRASFWRESLIAAGTAGVIILGRGPEEGEKAFYESRGIPYLLLDFEALEGPCLCIDNKAGGELAAAYLWELGCRQPAYIGTQDLEAGPQKRRWEGFRDFWVRRRIEPGVRLETVDGSSAGYLEAGRRAVLAWREQETLQGADGVFFYCDEMALGAWPVLREWSPQLPVIGFDGWPAAGFCALASVAPPLNLMGRTAAALMIDLLGGGRPPAFPIRFTAEIRRPRLSPV